MKRQRGVEGTVLVRRPVKEFGVFRANSVVSSPWSRALGLIKSNVSVSRTCLWLAAATSDEH